MVVVLGCVRIVSVLTLEVVVCAFFSARSLSYVSRNVHTFEYIGVSGGGGTEETTTEVPLDGFGGGGVSDDGGEGAVPIELVFFGSGGGGGAAVSWQPPLQLVTTIVEVVRVV